MAEYSERAAGILAILADRPVAYHPRLATVLGVKETVFVCQFLYWHGKGKLPDNWIYKTQQDITEETGLSRYEQETVRKRLKDRGILEERLAGIPATLHYRLVTDKLLEAIEQAYPDKAADIPAPSMRHSPAQVWGNPPNKEGETPQTETGEIPQTKPGGTPQSIPENTIDDFTDNTPQTTDNCAATAPRPPANPPTANPIPESPRNPDSSPDPGPDSLADLTPEQRRLAAASGLTAVHHAEATGGTAARIADPGWSAAGRDAPGSSPRLGDDPPWADDVRRALSDRRRFKLDHDLTPEHIVTVLARFEQHSSITVPRDPPRIRGWAKGARDCIAPMREYLQHAAGNGHGDDGPGPGSVRAGPDEAARLTVWAVDLFFARRERGEYDFAVHSPHSLANTIRALTADLRRLQQAQNLPPAQPPAWDEDKGTGRDWAQSDDPAVQAILEQEKWYKNREARQDPATTTAR